MGNENRPSGLGALAQKVIVYTVKVKRAEEALSERKSELADANEAMLIALAEAGISSVKYKGFTVHTVTQIFASLINHEVSEEYKSPKAKSMQALRDNELGWMVRDSVSVQTLKSWVKEHELDKETQLPKLPEELVEFIKVSSKIEVRVKKSS